MISRIALVSLTPEANKNITTLDDEDPRVPIHTWIASQSRDLDVILSEERGMRKEDFGRGDLSSCLG